MERELRHVEDMLAQDRKELASILLKRELRAL
jgi:hypothetical protein